MRKRIGFIAASLATTSTLLFAGLGMAIYDIGPRGGNGGQSGRDACPRGYMTGLVVGYADKVDNVRIICGEYLATGDPQREGEQRFGRTGQWHTQPLSCSDGMAVVGFQINSDRVVDRIGLLCAPISRLDVEVTARTDMLGGNGGRYQGEFRCSSGHAAVGISVRHGRLLDAFGLICNDPDSVAYDARAY